VGVVVGVVVGASGDVAGEGGILGGDSAPEFGAFSDWFNLPVLAGG
jgi:hypothetical protein